MIWHPTARLSALKARAAMYERLRQFFSQRKVLEVETPSLAFTCFENDNIKPSAIKNKDFHVPPIAYMQRLLAAGVGDIYQIHKIFHKTVDAKNKSFEGSVLQWCRIEYDLWGLMEEVADLLDSLLACQHFDYLSYQAVFEQYLGLNPFELTVEQLQFEAKQHLNIEIPRGTKDDWLSLLMSYLIEPLLGKDTPVFIYDYPASQCDMATLNHNETGIEITEKFQLYYKGEVLVTGFKGLTDSQAMQDRLQVENVQRTEKGLKALFLDNTLLQAMEYGIPPFAAAAVDLDKVLMRYVKANHLKDVISFMR